MSTPPTKTSERARDFKLNIEERVQCDHQIVILELLQDSSLILLTTRNGCKSRSRILVSYLEYVCRIHAISF